MNIFETFTSNIAQKIADRLQVTREELDKNRAYRIGVQPPQLLVRGNQYNDNVIVNEIGLIIDRAVTALVGHGVEIISENEAAQAFYDAFWEANRKDVTLHAAAQLAAECGTGYIKLVPMQEGMTRLIVLDPTLIVVETDPEDKDAILRYIITYNVTGPDGKEKTRRQVHQWNENGTEWEIIDYESSYATGGRWVEISNTPFPYPFSDIVHWQNLPNPLSVYGEPECGQDVLGLQDKYNLNASNLNKIIRLFAHPFRYGKGVQSSNVKVSPGEMVYLPDANSSIEQLAALGDISGAMGYMDTIKREIYNQTRTVDIDSLADKLGQLTNFGLRVLYQDMVAKTETKRLLFSEAIREINYRAMTMENQSNPEGGNVVYGDIVPVNALEQINEQQAEINLGIVSKATIAKERGRDYEAETQLINQERVSTDNIGAALLRNFNRGQ